jgi:SPP1 family phage portal protein
MKTEELDRYFDPARMEEMRKGRAYYAGHNDILERERTIIIRKSKFELKHLSNNRIAHPFLRKLVDQKIGYLLALPFSVHTDDEVLAARLGEFFDRAFYRQLKAIGRDAIVCGAGWMAVYYDGDGNLGTRRIAPETVAPIYDPQDVDRMIGAVRRYTAVGTKIYELWTLDGVQRFEDDNGELRPLGQGGHFTMGGESYTWERLPLIQFRYNADSRPLITLIKPLVDDYDARVSDVSNLLADTPNNVKLVRGHVEDPEEFVRNLATLNCLFVGEGGDVQNLESKVDVATHNAHLDRLRKDIFDAGSGVDTQEAAAGDLSGTAIRYRYSELDLDCKNMGAEFAQALEELVWFVEEDMRLRGEGEHDAQCDFIWNTDHIINELQTVQILAASKGLISDATIIENHPYVTDPEAEKQRIADEAAMDNAEY